MRDHLWGDCRPYRHRPNVRSDITRLEWRDLRTWHHQNERDDSSRLV